MQGKGITFECTCYAYEGCKLHTCGSGAPERWPVLTKIHTHMPGVEGKVKERKTPLITCQVTVCILG